MAISYHTDEFSYQIRFTGSLWVTGGAAVTGGVYAPGIAIGTVASTLATLWTWPTPWLSEDCTITSVYVANGTLSTEAPVTGGTGERTSQSASPNTAPVVSLKSSAGKGPRFQGRWFFPGVLSEGGLNDDGTLDSTFRTDFGAAIEQYLEDLVTEDIFPTVLSRTGGESPIPPNPVAISSFVVRERAGTQRRRLRR